MSDFYLILPCNSSMSYYQDNSLTSFLTRLPYTIGLEGDWEVGLVQIQCPQNWFRKTVCHISLLSMTWQWLGHMCFLSQVCGRVWVMFIHNHLRDVHGITTKWEAKKDASQQNVFGRACHPYVSAFFMRRDRVSRQFDGFEKGEVYWWPWIVTRNKGKTVGKYATAAWWRFDMFRHTAEADHALLSKCWFVHDVVWFLDMNGSEHVSHLIRNRDVVSQRHYVGIPDGTFEREKTEKELGDCNKLTIELIDKIYDIEQCSILAPACKSEAGKFTVRPAT